METAEWRLRSVGVSLQPAIPRRVASQQSPLPLHQSPTIVAQSQCGVWLRSSVALRIRPQRGCHLYFAHRVTFVSCADTRSPPRLPADADASYLRSVPLTTMSTWRPAATDELFAPFENGDLGAGSDGHARRDRARPDGRIPGTTRLAGRRPQPHCRASIGGPGSDFMTDPRFLRPGRIHPKPRWRRMRSKIGLRSIPKPNAPGFS